MRDTREELLEIQLSQANQKIAEQAAVTADRCSGSMTHVDAAIRQMAKEK